MKQLAVAALALVLLAGCAGRADDAAAPPDTGTPSASETQAATPSATPTPTPTETPTPSEEPADAASATCDNLLDASTIERFEANGASFSDNDKSDTYPFSSFVEYGGISCIWGGQLNVTTGYAYGPITDEQAATEKKKLEKDASKTGPNENGGTYFEIPNGEANEPDSMVIIFSPKGYWAMSFDNGGGPVFEEVVANAPVFY